MFASATTSNCKVAPFKAVTCPRKIGRVAAPRVAAIRKEADENVWSAMPMVCIGAVMLLNSGVANAATLGKGYGNSVGGSDQFKETVERGIGKVQQGVQDAPFNLPDPNNVDDGAAPSTTLKGALDQTVSNVTNTFSQGGDNAREASEGINSKVARTASNIKDNAPDVIQSGADNVQRNAEDSKNFFQSGAEKIQELIGGGGAEETFKTGVDKAAQAPKNIQSSFQSGADALTGGADKAKSAASDAQDTLQSGASGLKGVFQSGKQEAAKNVEKAKQTGGNVGDAFKTGTDQLEKGARKVQGLSDNVQQGVDDAAKKAQQTGKSIFGQ